MEPCLFCRIAAGELGTEFVYQDERVVAFRDVQPQAPTHLLFVPRQHTASLRETDDGESLAGLLLAARRTAARMNLGDYRLVINTGARAGQSVFHLHLHLLAGRTMAWPPG